MQPIEAAYASGGIRCDEKSYSLFQFCLLLFQRNVSTILRQVSREFSVQPG